MNILMVLTSHATLGHSGRATGVWLEEFAAPFYVFRDAGAQLTLASPRGGRPPVDPASEHAAAQTHATRRLKADATARALLADTRVLRDTEVQRFDAVFYPGGHGPLWDLVEDPHSIALLQQVLAVGQPLGLVCHAPAVLRDVRGEDGLPVLRGRRVTGFSNREEQAAGLAALVPFLLQDMLQSQGALYLQGPDGQPHVVVDGRLVTGQNPASAGPAARALCQLLPQRRAALAPAA